ncbi:MAG: lysine 6-aminotransferase, partial [Candidatus Eisenbacteria bacterium]|nr:lysine 6-aminotransferase [Candidatus Eisenbacteria bacterium]
MPTAVHDSIEILKSLRRATGRAKTRGIDDDWLSSRLSTDPLLARAIAEANIEFGRLSESEREFLRLPEEEACARARNEIVNFYPADGINPYLPLAARGP